METSIPMNSRLRHHGPSEGLRTDTKMNLQAGKGVKLLEWMMAVA